MFLAGSVFLIHEEGIFLKPFDAAKYAPTKLALLQLQPPALIVLYTAFLYVLENVNQYIKLLKELDLKLVKVIETHIHADHKSGKNILREKTNCAIIMGDKSSADVVTTRVADEGKIKLDGIELQALYTPGHTSECFSFLMKDRVFTGDTLLIRGTGRTDFQNGNPKESYNSIFNRLLKLPEETLVYPAHDYKGETVSTIGEEKNFNPRLQVKSVDEYVEIMNNLNLPNPKMMDVAVPYNLSKN